MSKPACLVPPLVARFAHRLRADVTCNSHPQDRWIDRHGCGASAITATLSLVLAVAAATAVGCSSAPRRGCPAGCGAEATPTAPIDGAAAGDHAGSAAMDAAEHRSLPASDGATAEASAAAPKISPDAASPALDAGAAPVGGPDGGGKLASRSVGYVHSALGNLPALAASANLGEMTHLIIAFANPTATESLALASSDADVAVLVSAAHAVGTKVLLAIGGATDTPRVLPQLAPDKVQAFVQTVVAFAEARDLDGVDVDVEDEGMPPAGYEALVSGLSAAFKSKGKLVTAAVASWFDAQITPRALGLMDFVSVMAYDGCNGSAPAPCQHSSYDSAVQALDHFVNGRKLPAGKVVLGVPFYGYCWGSGCGMSALTYADIASRFPGADAADFIDGPDAKVYYNGPATIARKAKLGRMHGGVMFWHLAADAPPPHSLLDVIGLALKE
jgi:hypothetical protein